MRQKISHILISILFVCSFALADKTAEKNLEQEIEAEFLFPNETEPRLGKLKVYYSPLADTAETVAKVARYFPSAASGIIQPIPYILKQMKSVNFEYQDGLEKKIISVPNPMSQQIADLLNFNAQGVVEDSNGNFKIVKATKIRVTASQKFTFEFGDTFGSREALKWMLLTGQVDYSSKTLDENNNIVEKKGSANIFKFGDPRIFQKFQLASNQRLVLPIGKELNSEVIYMGKSNDSKHIFIRKQDLDANTEGVAVYAIAPELISKIPKENEQLLREPFFLFLPTIAEGIEPLGYLKLTFNNDDLDKKVDVVQDKLAKQGIIGRILPCQRFFTRLLTPKDKPPASILYHDSALGSVLSTKN